MLFVCLFVCGRIIRVSEYSFYMGPTLAICMKFVLDMMEQCQYNEKSLNVPKGNDVFYSCDTAVHFQFQW
jgi:hypothetical protein